MAAQLCHHHHPFWARPGEPTHLIVRFVSVASSLTCVSFLPLTPWIISDDLKKGRKVNSRFIRPHCAHCNTVEINNDQQESTLAVCLTQLTGSASLAPGLFWSPAEIKSCVLSAAANMSQRCSGDTFEAGNATEVVLSPLSCASLSICLYVDRYCQYDYITAVQDAVVIVWKCS